MATSYNRCDSRKHSHNTGDDGKRFAVTLKDETNRTLGFGSVCGPCLPKTKHAEELITVCPECRGRDGNHRENCRAA